MRERKTFLGYQIEAQSKFYDMWFGRRKTIGNDEDTELSRRDYALMPLTIPMMGVMFVTSHAIAAPLLAIAEYTGECFRQKERLPIFEFTDSFKLRLNELKYASTLARKRIDTSSPKALLRSTLCMNNFYLFVDCMSLPLYQMPVFDTYATYHTQLLALHKKRGALNPELVEWLSTIIDIQNFSVSLDFADILPERIKGICDVGHIIADCFFVVACILFGDVAQAVLRDIANSDLSGRVHNHDLFVDDFLIILPKGDCPPLPPTIVLMFAGLIADFMNYAEYSAIHTHNIVVPMRCALLNRIQTEEELLIHLYSILPPEKMQSLINDLLLKARGRSGVFTAPLSEDVPLRSTIEQTRTITRVISQGYNDINSPLWSLPTELLYAVIKFSVDTDSSSVLMNALISTFWNRPLVTSTSLLSTCVNQLSFFAHKLDLVPLDVGRPAAPNG